MTAETIDLNANLSEILFKPKHNYIETSLISNSGCPLPPLDPKQSVIAARFRPQWYRPLNLFSWSSLGANNMDVEEALARIVSSTNARTRPTCFDTVEQYGPGNWIYEFCAIAQERVHLGMKATERGDLEDASHQYRMASRYFAIGAYPNLKGDVLAAQASLLCRQSYRKIFNDPNRYGYYSTESFTVRGEKVTGFLHSCDNHSLQPCVVICASYEATITDYFALFSNYLRKQGIAIFVIDMPGMGEAHKITLDANSSDILQAAIEHLRDKVKFIDSTAIGVFGTRTSANAVGRLCILRPDLIKAAVMISPFLHSAFVNKQILLAMPLASRSSLANRMNLDASVWEAIVPQLQALSLKTQGILSYGTKVNIPTLVVYLNHDLKFSEDPKLLAQAFKQLETEEMRNTRVSTYMGKIFTKTSQFFKEKLL